MLKSFFITAVRNLLRNKFYSFINIFGLAIGIACFLLIMLYVKDELSYDRHHSKSERIYRVIGKLNLEGQGEESSSCPFPVGPTIKQDFPQLVEHSVRFFNFQDPQHTLRVGEKKINESRLFVADSNVFQVFDFPLTKGNPLHALAEPNSIVLTEAMAEKYFGNEDPIGKLMKFDGAADLKVTGILAGQAEQSHIHFDGLISFSTLNGVMGPNLQKNWVWNPNWTYVLLKEGVSPKELEAQFPDYVQKYYPDFLKPQVKHELQALKDIHLHSKYSYEIEANGDASNIWIFSAIGIFILLIAAFNFMNLATARSANRAREVGIRKVSGAYKRQLIFQFLSESVLISLLAIILAIFLSELLLPAFNSVAEKTIDISFFKQSWIIPSLLGIGLFTGLFAGTYPAFYLSSFEPVKVLKGKLSTGSKNIGLRKTLVIAQFAISLVLIISSAVIYKQLNHMRSADLGFTKEQVLMLPVRPPMAKMYDPFIAELKENKSVINVATMNDVIGRHHNTHEYNYKGMEKGKWIYFPSLLVNETFTETMGMEILAGRNFSKEYVRDDSLGVIVNEAMVKHMGWKDATAAIGEQFYTPFGNEKIIGVVKNFNFVSVHTPVGPFVLDMPHRKQKPYWTRYIAIRIASDDIQNTLAFINDKWDNYNQEFPFEYFFLNEDLDKQYKAQENLSKLMAYFTGLAIIIACLGLFALASFSAEQRTREIGIRKVMGASHYQILYLLTSDFGKLVLFSAIIAFPLAWFIMGKWLENFASRINIPVEIFLISGLIAFLIAMITVSFQALKAAWSNPVTSLRYE